MSPSTTNENISEVLEILNYAGTRSDTHDINGNTILSAYYDKHVKSTGVSFEEFRKAAIEATLESISCSNLIIENDSVDIANTILDAYRAKISGATKKGVTDVGRTA